MSPPASPQSPPNAPNVVLRVGFAGKRQLNRPQTATVRTSLQHVFSTIAQRLTEIAPVNHAENTRPVPSIATIRERLAASDPRLCRVAARPLRLAETPERSGDQGLEAVLQEGNQPP